MMRVVRASLALAAAVGVLAVAVLLAITLKRGVTHPIGYWTIDERTLGVAAFSGLEVDCELTGIEETAASVKVTVVCQEPWLIVGAPAALHEHEFQVDLEAVLAGRPVLDGLGNRATLCGNADLCSFARHRSSQQRLALGVGDGQCPLLGRGGVRGLSVYKTDRRTVLPCISTTCPL
jgi:hypothetical protein